MMTGEKARPAEAAGAVDEAAEAQFVEAGGHRVSVLLAGGVLTLTVRLADDGTHLAVRVDETVLMDSNTPRGRHSYELRRAAELAGEGSAATEEQ
jgi:hypothetical protein